MSVAALPEVAAGPRGNDLQRARACLQSSVKRAAQRSRLAHWVQTMLLPCLLLTSASSMLLSLAWLCTLLYVHGPVDSCPYAHWESVYNHAGYPFIFSFLRAAGTGVVALRVFAISNSTYLRNVAWFAAMLWTDNAFDVLVRLGGCEGLKAVDDLWYLPWCIHGLGNLMFVGLLHGRLAALESTSLVELGAARLLMVLRCIALPVVLFSLSQFFMDYNSVLFRSLMLYTYLLWWMAAQLVAVRGLLAAAYFAQATICAQQERHRSESVRQAAGDLARQARAALQAMVWSTAATIGYALIFQPVPWPLPILGANIGEVIFEITYSADVLSKAYAVVVLYSCGHGAKQRAAERKRQRRRTATSVDWHREMTVRPLELRGWDQRVHELAGRAVSLEALLRFYAGLGREYMPHFVPSRHTTLDVVRQAIIPLSAARRCAYAVILQDGVYTRPHVMVTHTWSGLFRDLVSSAVADALAEPEFAQIAQLLDEDPTVLQNWLASLGLGSRTYWICALSVNQHCSTCDRTRSVDSVTGAQHPSCHCGLPKALNTSPPTLADGRSIPCELNKFMIMLRLLAASDRGFQHVIAIDRDFCIFRRAWCMAEIAVGAEMGLRQHLKLSSATSLQEREETLRGVSIRNMEASRPEDKEEIIAGIQDIDAFDRDLQSLLFDDLLASWNRLDGAEKMALAGQAIRWQRIQPSLRRVAV